MQLHNAKKAIALDAISKAETSRLRGRRNGHVIWTEGEQDHDESVTADFSALNTSLSSSFNKMIEFQTRSFNKMLEQQERHTQIKEKILETQTSCLSESSQPRFQSKSPGRPEGYRPRTSAMQCYNCREFRHLSNLDGQKHKALVDTGSNVNILSEKAYSQYKQRSKLRPFREQVISATNDPFEILSVFTGEITFDTEVKVRADLLVTPNTDVPLIPGNQVME